MLAEISDVLGEKEAATAEHLEQLQYLEQVSARSWLELLHALYTLTVLPIVVTMFKCLICAYLHVRD